MIALRTISTFSCDIAHAVSNDPVGEVGNGGGTPVRPPLAAEKLGAIGQGQAPERQDQGGGEILTREDTLRLLSEMAQSGSVTAAIALERALRVGPAGVDDDDEDDILAELDAFHPTRRPRPSR